MFVVRTPAASKLFIESQPLAPMWSSIHVLMNTALGDDRVAPMHSFKYLATLQNSDTGSRPKLLRIEQDAGHGEGKSNGQLIDEFTDLWSFAAHETQLRVDD